MRPVSDDPASAATGIARVSETPPPAGPAGAEAVSPAPPVAVEALAAAVAAGALDPAAAAERLIAATVAAQRPAPIDPQAWAAVEREVSALLAGDPALADLLAPL
ncbi:MAG TPA: hypothetical protein VIK91_04555 [Nannocystis sp.]